MDKMQAYREKAEARLKEIGARIDQLKARGENAGADLRLETRNKIEQLKQRGELYEPSTNHLRTT